MAKAFAAPNIVTSFAPEVDFGDGSTVPISRIRVDGRLVLETHDEDTFVRACKHYHDLWFHGKPFKRFR